MSQHAFATPEKLAAIAAAVSKALELSYPLAISKMKLYLEKAKTQAVLLKPIKSNILEAHGQVAVLLEGYDPAAVAQIGLMSAEQVQLMLDKFT